MALSIDSIRYFKDALTSDVAGNELALAIHNGAILSQDTMVRLVIALSDSGVAANLQAAILGTRSLSARDLEYIADAFSSEDVADDIAANVAGGAVVIQPNPPVGYLLPSGYNVSVVTVGPAQQQIIQLSMPAGSAFSSSGAGASVTLSNAGNAQQYYLWYSVVGGSNTDPGLSNPALSGFIGIEVDILASDSAAAVANASYAASEPILNGLTPSVSGNVMSVAAAVVQSAAALPSFSPAAGSYSSTQLVSISSATPGASIYYTTNGSAPTISSSLYVAPISVGASETLKALAVQSGFANSLVASAAYTITAPGGVASQLVWTTQPSTAKAGVAFATQPVITIKDSSNATVTTGADATALITLTLLTGTGALAGTVSMNAVAGVANFAGKGLNISLYGNKILRATKANTVGGGGTASFFADSASLNISNSLAAVNLHTAANYAILSESGITNTSGSLVTGAMGVSPIAASSITGFALVLDGGGTFSTSSQVVGHVYAADYASPTPSNLTTAIGDMSTAYTDAAGRPTPDFTNLGSGELAGLTLTPGLYKWTTGITISNNVTISGGPNDIWIFQIAGTLVMSAAKSIILSGGAKAENIFWQVAGAVTVGANAVFNGILLGQTSIALQTNAAFNGRALAQTAVTLDANAVTQKP